MSSKGCRPSWRSESRNSRANDAGSPKSSSGNDALLRKSRDLPRAETEGPQNLLRVFAFLRDADGVRGGRHGVFRGVGDDPPLSDSGDVDRRGGVAGSDVGVSLDLGAAL